MSDTIPLPKDPRHQRIADLVLGGMQQSEAYRQVYPKGKTESARPLAARVMKRPDVRAYMGTIRQRAASAQVLSITEKREFCARVVRARITELPDNSDLWQEYREEETETSHRIFKKLPSKTDCLKIDNDLDDEAPGTTALDQLATALAKLR